MPKHRKPAKIDEDQVYKVLNGLKRCRRGDTFVKCETECFYGKTHKYDCMKWLLSDAIKLIEKLFKEALKGRYQDDEDEDE